MTEGPTLANVIENYDHSADNAPTLAAILKEGIAEARVLIPAGLLEGDEVTSLLPRVDRVTGALEGDSAKYLEALLGLAREYPFLDFGNVRAAFEACLGQGSLDEVGFARAWKYLIALIIFSGYFSNEENGQLAQACEFSRHFSGGEAVHAADGSTPELHERLVRLSHGVRAARELKAADATERGKRGAPAPQPPAPPSKARRPSRRFRSDEVRTRPRGGPGTGRVLPGPPQGGPPRRPPNGARPQDPDRPRQARASARVKRRMP